MSNDRITSELGLIRPFVEAEIVMASGRTANISGAPYQKAARILRYLRLQGGDVSFNTKKANELAGILVGMAALVRKYPKTIKPGGTIEGLKPYAPTSERQQMLFPRVLVLEALTMLKDALGPFLSERADDDIEAWLPALLAAVKDAEEQLTGECDAA